MNYQTLNLTIDQRRVAYLTLARPDKHNAMDEIMLEELTHATKHLDLDTSLRAVVLSGQGTSFCAGVDLGWMRRNLPKPRPQRIAESKKLTMLLHQFSSLGKLLIARVNGQAYAGGIGLIATADIAIGVNDARFSLTETRLGLVPANIAPYVIARMGQQNARRCMLNAHFFHSDEAVALGLLDQSVSATELDATIEKEITEVLQCAPNAVAESKQMLKRLATMKHDETMPYTSELLADMWEHEQAQDGITAFLNKTTPKWVVAVNG